MTNKREMKLTAELVARVHRDVPDPGATPGVLYMEDADHEILADEILRDHPRGADLWIFAYGSLMWRPACEIDGQELAFLKGWHRKFCIRIVRFRGTAEVPGLMMALDRGGSCRALVQRLAGGTARSRLVELLRREVLLKGNSSNYPRWVAVHTPSGRRRAVVFAVRRSSPFYSGDYPAERVASILATAVGHWGSGAEYLMNTVQHLEALGIHDRNLWRLQELVATQIMTQSDAVPT
jgi:cation transport protein ChaC